MDRTSVVKEMYQGYLDAHDLLVAGTRPSDIPELAAFSARMDESTIFYFQSLELVNGQVVVPAGGHVEVPTLAELWNRPPRWP